MLGPREAPWCLSSVRMAGRRIGGMSEPYPLCLPLLLGTPLICLPGPIQAESNSVPTRLAKALLRLVQESELPDGGGKLTITQRELSQVIGRSRESTNKQLRIWAKQGWVRLQRGAVTVLQPDKLVEVAAESAELDAS